MTIARFTVKDLRTIAADEGVAVAPRALKADLVEAIEAHRAAAAEKGRTGPFTDTFLVPATEAQLARIRESAIEVGGLTARKNRDALASMNLKDLADGKSEVAKHRVRKEVIRMLAPFGFTPKAHGPITESRGSLDLTTSDPEDLLALGAHLREVAQTVWDSDDAKWVVATQQAALYAGRAEVHAAALRRALA